MMLPIEVSTLQVLLGVSMQGASSML